MNGDNQIDMFHLAAAGAAPAPVTSEEIDFDSEPAGEEPAQERPAFTADGDSTLQARGESASEPGATADASEGETDGIPGKREPDQLTLLHVPEFWEEHWRGMPEFKQENLMPFKTIFLHFETRIDMEKFSQVVGQKIGLKTQSIWYPEATIEHWDKQWVDKVCELEDADIETVEE